MGSSLDYRVYKTSDKQAIEKAFSDDAAADRLENGSSYSGQIGVLGQPIIFAAVAAFSCEADASDFMFKHHEKWSPALAVPFLYSDNPVPAALLKFGLKINAAAEKRGELNKKLVAEFEAGKSEFVGCKNCKSKIARQFIKFTVSCPACHKSLLSETALKRIAASKAKVDALIEQRKAEEIKAIRACGKVGYIVGGHCSS